jgi:8-oxo-dGTP pyrophosphatase MutT (NUDIX family)
MRAAIVLLEDGAVALIERVRDGRRYYLFPGGGVEHGETPEEAATREAREELGLEVEIVRLVAHATFQGSEQRYYLARRTGGSFGSGDGDEMTGDVAGSGSYRAVRWPVATLPLIEVRPHELALLVRRATASGWSADVVELAG